MMTPHDLPALLACIPPLCRLAAQPDVQRAIDRLISAPDSPLDPLCTALAAHPEGLSLKDADLREMLPLLGICRQCSADELITVASRCTAMPTAEGLSLLVAAHRHEEARTQYALQLLWRLLGDESIPDALTICMLSASAGRPESIRQHILNDLRKEAGHAASA